MTTVTCFSWSEPWKWLRSTTFSAPCVNQQNLGSLLPFHVPVTSHFIPNSGSCTCYQQPEAPKLRPFLFGPVESQCMSNRKCQLGQSVSCTWLCDPMDCSLLSSSVHGFLQARILEWVAIPSSRGSSQPRGRTWVSCIAGWSLLFEPQT